MTITGPAAGVTINGGGTSNFTYLGGVFEVATGATASLSSLTITNGYAEGGGGVFINNGASATFTDCTISGNSTVEDGAGILCVGNVVLVDSTVSGNSTPAAGGGLVLDASTDSATLINTTVSGNSAGYFGGIVALGDTTIANSIVAGNTSPVDPDTEGQFFSEGGNLIGAVANSSGWTSSDLTGTVAKPLDPLLAPLGNYGGPTQTMALLPGSPAIDAGSNALIPSGTTTDQRGLPRIVNGTVDIGAFESSGFSIAATSGSGQTAGVFAPLVVTVTANNPNEPVAGGQITFTPPGSGASAFVTDNPATIGTSGTASGTALSNGVVGSYTVAARAKTGASGVASFSLTNLALKSIAVTPGNPELAEGVAGQFTATDTYSDGSTGDITDYATWASATPTVATISGTGLATALIPGTSAITASVAGVTSPADTLTVIASFVVNTTADTFGFYSGTTSLREAIAGANAVPGQTITFSPTVFASAQTITLSLGQLTLSDTSGTEAITGPAAGVTVNADGLSRVFEVDAGVAAAISGLTISGGSASEWGGGLAIYGTATLSDCTISGNTGGSNWGGGGLVNDGSGAVTLTDCTLTNNYGGATGSGGAIENEVAGTVTLTECTVSGNTGYRGGAISNYSMTGTVELLDCTVSGNTATYTGGGGIENRGTLTLTDCTVADNRAAKGGGGVYNEEQPSEKVGGSATLTNCTVSGNSATGGSGGGVQNLVGTISLTNCTISDNVASASGGGVAVTATNTLTIGNSIVAGNTATTSDPDVIGAFTSQGHNLIGKTDGSTGWVGSDLTGTIASPLNALMAPLANYGGPTETMALLPGSPAIDAGNNALIPSGVTTDQRGLPRIVGGTVDIGAFESSGFTIAVVSGSGQSANITEPFASPLVASVTANNANEPIAGGQIIFTGPGAGPSTSPSVNFATIAADGTASATITANIAAGTYTVTAAASKESSTASFSLTNVGSLIVNTTSDAADTGPGLTTLRLAIDTPTASPPAPRRSSSTRPSSPRPRRLP